MADSLARKVAQQIIEKFYAKDLDRGYGQNPLRMTLTEGEMAEIIESALAPMREALQAMTDAMNRMLVSFAGKDEELCMECGEKQGSGEGCDTCYVIGESVKALARAAEVLKGGE